MGEIDFGRHSDDYTAHRPGFPESFYRRLDAIVPIAGTRSLDLATGPGTIAIEFAERGSVVVGIDVSAEQIAAATQVSKAHQLDGKLSFTVATAEHTGLNSHSFDVATAGQCWHWFDRRAVMDEMRRVLRPDGVLIVAYYSYVAGQSSVARETENLILRFNPSWTMAGSSGMHPEWVDELIDSGFRLVEQFCYDNDEQFTHDRWRGRMRTCNGVGSGGLSPSDVQRFDDELGQLLRREYPDPMIVEHRVWSAIVTPDQTRRFISSGVTA